MVTCGGVGQVEHLSEISINKVENIDEVEQKSLLTTCTTKLHRYYKVTLYILDFHRNFLSKIPPSFIIPPYYLGEISLLQNDIFGKYPDILRAFKMCYFSLIQSQ